MTADADITRRSNALFSAIVATVAASSGRRLTVEQIAHRVGTPPDVAASCIALHRHFRLLAQGSEGRFEAILAFPPPPEFKIPAPGDTIDETALGLIFDQSKQG